jgi:hypothetical protein
MRQTTRSCPGTYSDTSLLSSPNARSGPPQDGDVAGGACTTSSRGRCLGQGALRRFDARRRLRHDRLAGPFLELLRRQLELRTGVLAVTFHARSHFRDICEKRCRPGVFLDEQDNDGD